MNIDFDKKYYSMCEDRIVILEPISVYRDGKVQCYACWLGSNVGDEDVDQSIFKSSEMFETIEKVAEFSILRTIKNLEAQTGIEIGVQICFSHKQ